MCARPWRGITFPPPRPNCRAIADSQGATPDYVEALSWMARASLQSNQLDRAQTYARQTESLSRQLLTKRPLDAEPHLPTALGAAIEVQAQVLASRGEPAQAVALLRHSLVAYRNTSIHARLQKNLNLLALVGTACASSDHRAVPGPKAGDPGRTQGLAGAAFLLGALVLGLQGGGSDH